MSAAAAAAEQDIIRVQDALGEIADIANSTRNALMGAKTVDDAEALLLGAVGNMRAHLATLAQIGGGAAMVRSEVGAALAMLEKVREMRKTIDALA